ncbi:Ribonucleases P/MRP protein subunit pop1 [Coniothyrium glycines]
MADSAKKRKQPLDGGPSAKRSRFPGKPQHHISTAATKSAYPNGEVNVKNFLRSHENEIKSLEHAMKTAKKGLSRRAFQDVPRELRRRTASHNPQRVPKRLRQRAKQEAKEDNTPTARGTSGSGIGKGKKKHLRQAGIEKSRKIWEERAKHKKADKHKKAAGLHEKSKTQRIPRASNQPNTKRKFPAPAIPPTPPSRFRRRQRDKTWLPTHLWHTKRARMTDPKEPLWRFAIPLSPVVKSYRLTHRAATQRGAVAWDMSYMSTISLEGPEAGIVGILKGLHFAIDSVEDPWQDKGRAKKWMRGTRVWDGWLCAREAKPPKKIAHVTVIWCVPETEESKRKVFLRVHPAAFLHIWHEVVRISRMQRPGIAVHDLRFEMGSIEITGPAAAETLVSILSPVTGKYASDAPQSLWNMFAFVTDAASLPPGALFAFDVSDPRYNDPPTTTSSRSDQASMSTATELLVTWPLDNTQTTPSIFDTKARLAGQHTLQSQKSINRRKSSCTLGQAPEPRPTDPKIPVLIYVTRESRSWTVLLPWKCVMPIWRGITRYPIATGGNPRFGGLKERRQVNFEKSMPMFPYDYPGTDAGWVWELQQREIRQHEWTKRPKGKRIEWSTIDLGKDRRGELGDPWACAWEHLLPPGYDGTTGAVNENVGACSPMTQFSSKQAQHVLGLDSSSLATLPTSSLVTVKVTMVQRGIPADCARIYRLPQSNEDLKQKWLNLIPRHGLKKSCKQQQPRSNDDVQTHLQHRNLARSLLEPHFENDGIPKAGEQGYPIVPDEEDLIGFVTTGNYNLAKGVPTAIANIAVHKVAGNPPGATTKAKNETLCIIRQAGSTIGRLAKWEVI